MNIRPAQPADLDALVDLARECFGPSAWNRAQFEAIPLLLTADKDEERNLGFCAIQIAADEAELQALAVRAAHRRRGLGAALLEAALRRTRERGAGAVFLEVRQSNQPAQAFYHRFGFEPCGLRPRYYQQPEEPAVLMRLSLTSGPVASHLSRAT